MNNKKDKQFISGEPSQEKILPALKALGFHRTRPTLLVLGNMQTVTDEEEERILQLYAEGVGPLVEQHSINVVVNAHDAQLLSLLNALREVRHFSLFVVQAGIHNEMPCDLHLSGDATPLDEMKASLAVSLALAQQISAVKCSLATLLVHGDDTDWDRLCLCIQEGMPLIVAKGTGGIADKIAQAFSYYTNRGKTTPKRKYERRPSLSRSDLLAAGFLAHSWVKMASSEDPEQFSSDLKGQLGLLDN